MLENHAPFPSITNEWASFGGMPKNSRYKEREVENDSHSIGTHRNDGRRDLWLFRLGMLQMSIAFLLVIETPVICWPTCPGQGLCTRSTPGIWEDDLKNAGKR